MKYTSKSQYYPSPNPDQGLFENAFVQTGQRIIDSEKGTFTVKFDLRYVRDDREIVLESKAQVFAEHQPTIILNENNEEEDIREFLLRGGTYEKERIVRWGRPSFENLSDYFDMSTVWGELQITQNEPQRSIAKDWIDAVVLIQGVPIGENFELET